MVGFSETSSGNIPSGTFALCWLNGQTVPSSSASISIFDRGFAYGDGVFETLRLERGQPLFWTGHWERMNAGVGAMGLPPMESASIWVDRIQKLAQASHTKEAIIRLQITRGIGGRGYAPPIEPALTSLITLHHAPEWAQPKPRSWQLSVSSIRMPSALPNVSMKTCNKWMQIQVKREALQLGLDDAMILNEKGNLTEVSCANCFVIEENCLITPPISDGCLDGVTRQQTMALARQLGVHVKEQSIALEEALRSDGIFLTLSTYGMLHVSKLDDRAWSCHPITLQVYDAYLSSVAQTLNHH